MVTLYNVISADGYIAHKDGNEDFIPESYWTHTLAILSKYDCIMMGRKTYETIQSYDKEMRDSFEKLPAKKIIITKNKDFRVKNGYEIAHTPEEIINLGLNIVVTSGPILNNYLIHNKLVDKIIYHEVPESIGEGIKPYDNFGNIERSKLLII